MSRAPIRIIGVDCATAATNVGLALGWYDGTHTTITTLTTGSTQTPVLDILRAWLVDDQPTLMTLDAPLGWPIQLGRDLQLHRAGEPVATPPERLFRRETDRFVRARVHKQPLEVGADRIARTAHAALTLLAALRSTTRQAIPLAWAADAITGVHAIEVYPAATLRAHGYRQHPSAEPSAARAILAMLAERVRLPATAHQITSRHAVDAAVCVLAGVDFLTGTAHPPEDLDVATKEGWIWTKLPSEGIPDAPAGTPS